MKELSLSQAAAEAQKFAQTIRAFSKLTDVIDAAVAAEQLAKESAAATEKSRAELVKLEASIGDAREDLGKAKEAAAKAIADGKGKAAAAIDNAETKASKIVAEAEAIKAEAETLLASNKAIVADLGREVQAKRTELADLEARIAKARDQARALLGG